MPKLPPLKNWTDEPAGVYCRRGERVRVMRGRKAKVEIVPACAHQRGRGYLVAVTTWRGTKFATSSSGAHTSATPRYAHNFARATTAKRAAEAMLAAEGATLNGRRKRR